MSYTREQIEKSVKAKGYVWFEDASNKTYDVNIIGVRNNAPSIADKVTNVFDDHLTISFKDESLNPAEDTVALASAGDGDVPSEKTVFCSSVVQRQPSYISCQ